MSNFSQRINRIAPLVSFAVFFVALAVVRHEIRTYHWDEIEGALRGMPWLMLLAMAVLTLLSYAALSLYDRLALEYAGEKLPYYKVLLTSFMGYALSNNVGHSLISGGSIRYRFYSNWGISAVAIAKIILFCSATYFIGIMTLMSGMPLCN
jgi:phosphatidylglycerol lysyltransferase